ncbi:MAG: metallophosphoesterase, partial [Desulfobacterales bacterium]|nr:metallophosphoesterase [Desulfobacterales bacterium]
IRLCILGVLGLAGGRGFMNSRALSLSRIEVRLNRLPPMFDGLKVGQITDIHAGPLVSQAQLRMGVDLLQAARPDLVALTGDFVSGATKILRTSYGGFNQRHYDYCLEELSKIRAPLGVFAVLGNHDFWSGTEVAEKIVAGLEQIGVRVLRNEAVFLEREAERLYLVGVDDYWEGSYNLAQSLRGIPEDSCRILLSHNPDVNEDIDLSRSRIDCVISGHTHGGQIVLPLIGAPYLPSPFGQKYRAGLVSDGERRTYVSRGLGVFFVPVRLNCPPEVTLLTFRMGSR